MQREITVHYHFTQMPLLVAVLLCKQKLPLMAITHFFLLNQYLPKYNSQNNIPMPQLNKKGIGLSSQTHKRDIHYSPSTSRYAKRQKSELGSSLGLSPSLHCTKLRIYIN